MQNKICVFTIKPLKKNHSKHLPLPHCLALLMMLPEPCSKILYGRYSFHPAFITLEQILPKAAIYIK